MRIQWILGTIRNCGSLGIEKEFMKKDFWLERWERKEIGFHQNEINPYLLQHWSVLSLQKEAEVFVPLCGKTLDMMWLMQQGFNVLGVELSSIAVNSFFTENNIKSNQITLNKFVQHESPGIKILFGDFFDLEKADLSNIKAVYDRASLVALPPEMRQRYVRHLVSILPPKTRILLVTFDYPQAEMSGPPFAVTHDEVTALFKEYAEVQLLAHHDALNLNPRFKQRGLSRISENIYLLTLK